MATKDSERNEFIEELKRVKQIGKQLFGAAWDEIGTKEVFEYLQGTDDEEVWANDLKDVIEIAKDHYDTSTPTPSQVFVLFRLRYGSDE